MPKQASVANQQARLSVCGVTAEQNGYSATGRWVKLTPVYTHTKAGNTAWTWQVFNIYAKDIASNASCWSMSVVKQVCYEL